MFQRFSQGHTVGQQNLLLNYFNRIAGPNVTPMIYGPHIPLVHLVYGRFCVGSYQTLLKMVLSALKSCCWVGCHVKCLRYGIPVWKRHICIGTVKI